MHMKAHPALARRAVKPRSRKAVREAQGLTARTSPKPSFVMPTRADAVRLIKFRILQIQTGHARLWRVSRLLHFSAASRHRPAAAADSGTIGAFAPPADTLYDFLRRVAQHPN